MHNWIIVNISHLKTTNVPRKEKERSPPCCMVDGSTFSPADSDTKKAKGITQRHTVKYASTFMPNRKNAQNKEQPFESWIANKQGPSTSRLKRLQVNLCWTYFREWIILLCKVLEGHIMVDHHQYWDITRRSKGGGDEISLNRKWVSRHSNTLAFTNWRESLTSYDFKAKELPFFFLLTFSR